MTKKAVLTHREALKAVLAVKKELENQGKGAAVAVTDAHGELLAFLRTDGCKLPSIQNAINKAYTASRECTESKIIGDRSKKEAFPMTNFGDLSYIGWGGGIPVYYRGEVAGAVGVSGLPEEEDMKLAKMAADLLSK